MTEAPLHNDIADAPEGGRAAWLTTTDKLRLRVAHWTHPSAKGTVLLFPGRTEYIEKYGRSVRDLRARGYATVVIDWRGQGLSDRINGKSMQGHVGEFPDYQKDVRALLAYVRANSLPEPLYLLAHSMGGCIGLRALYEGLPVKAATFSAPMWGILMSRMIRPFAWATSTIAKSVGFSDSFVPGQTSKTYLATVSFKDNTLTSDPDMFAYMRNQILEHPELSLGGPSLRWLNESLNEMSSLSRRPAPETPCLTLLGSDELIVDPAQVKARLADWKHSRLVLIETARHEVLMEAPAIRNRAFDETATHFDAHP